MAAKELNKHFDAPTSNKNEIVQMVLSVVLSNPQWFYLRTPLPLAFNPQEVAMVLILLALLVKLRLSTREYLPVAQ